MEIIKNALRWVFVLPCAYFAFYICTFCGSALTPADRYAIPSVAIGQLLASVASGWAGVHAGVRVAPSNKDATAVVITVLYVAWSVYLLTSGQGSSHSFVGTVVSVGGAVAATVQTSRGNTFDPEPRPSKPT